MSLRTQTGSMCWSEACATSSRNAVFRCLTKIYNRASQKRLNNERQKQFQKAFDEIRPFLGTDDDDDVFGSEVKCHSCAD